MLCSAECPANLEPNNTRPCSGHGQCLAGATCDCNSTQLINSNGTSPFGSPFYAPVDLGWRGPNCSIPCPRWPDPTNGSICRCGAGSLYGVVSMWSCNDCAKCLID